VSKINIFKGSSFFFFFAVLMFFVAGIFALTTRKYVVRDYLE
jgi:hypothetical protein